MRRIRGAITQRLGSTAWVQAVFYPMSGVDAATPFRLLPDARVVVGFDNHAFQMQGKAHIEEATHIESAYDRFEDVDAQASDGAASALLARLAQALCAA
jgi:hypothetical protein